MREILFRGKRVDNGEWVYGDLLSHTDVVQICVQTGGGEQRYEVIPKTVGQYTGQIALKEKKVYEGDIVELEGDDGELYEVSWDDDSGCFIFENETDLLSLDDVRWGSIIVGNIFDNPDMADW